MPKRPNRNWPGPCNSSLLSLVVTALTFFAWSKAAAAADPEDCAANGGNRICAAPVVGPWRYTVCENLEAYPGRMATWCAAGGGMYGSNYCQGDAPIANESAMVSRSVTYETLLHNACSAGANWSGWGVPVTAPLCKHPGTRFKGDIEESTSSIIDTHGVGRSSSDICEVPFEETLYGMRDRAIDCPDSFSDRINAQNQFECVHRTCMAPACAAACAPDDAPVREPPIQIGWKGSATKPCPNIFGGDAGFSFSLTGTTQANGASCSNGCKSESMIKGAGEGDFSVCGGKGFARGLVASIDGTVEQKITYAKQCLPTSCTSVCDTSRACKKETGSASIQGGGAWNASHTFSTSFAGALVGVAAHCHGTVGLKAGGKVEWSVSNNIGYPGACDDCTTRTYGPTIEGSAKGSCTLAVARTLPAGEQGSGIVFGETKDALDISYSQEFLYTEKSGACGNETCLTSKIGAKIGAMFASPCVKLFGRGVKLGVKGQVGGSCSGSSCSNVDDNGCKWNPDFTTAVLQTCK